MLQVSSAPVHKYIDADCWNQVFRPPHGTSWERGCSYPRCYVMPLPSYLVAAAAASAIAATAATMSVAAALRGRRQWQLQHEQ